MKKYLIPALMLGAITLPASAAEVQIQASGPVVELSVSETVKARPDIATISAGVTSEAPTAVAAMRQNAEAMDAVIKRIKSLGIADRDIQTTGISLGARYNYDQASQRQVFQGYTASNQVSVILRKVADTGKVLDSLVAAGATDLGGPQFSIDDDTAVKAQARKGAMERAKAQAMEYATWAGYTGLRLLEVSESISADQPMPMVQRAMADFSEKGTTVEPGLVGMAVYVTVKYEMTR